MVTIFIVFSEHDQKQKPKRHRHGIVNRVIHGNFLNFKGQTITLQDLWRLN